MSSTDRDVILGLPTLSGAGLLKATAEIVSELASEYEELSYVQAEETRLKAEGFARSQESSLQGRDRDARMAALEASTSVARLSGSVAAMEVVKDFALELCRRER